MGRKVKEKTKSSFRLLDPELKNELQKSISGIKFIHFIDGNKKILNSNINFDKYEATLFLDSNTEVFFKYYKEKGLIRFIFYILIDYPEKTRNPTFAFDYEMPYSRYLDLMENVVRNL